ncbi:MAG TPA: EscU/YscU/HrcU family type III secretion system export apparatus switch protein [Bryobacteraceae bacterium]|jgi:flagellar biosynthetic protein FlhB|nr:EscU/YscU/HrcU family type III secretion system export apparatus switch protein [Bryobacteraceae bacterium]
MADTGQQTEKATPRRLEKARKEGNFPAAREFVSAVQFFAFIAFGAAWFPVWMQSAQSAFQLGLRQAFAPSLTPTDLFAIFGRLSNVVLRPLATLGVILLAITILFQLASTNMGFSLARLTPKWERLNGFQKLKEMPGRNFGSFLQAAIMIPVMFWLTWSLVRERLPELLRLPMMPVSTGAAAAGQLVQDAMRKASFVLVTLGLFMLVRERGRYSKRMRMSKQDIRDESKETEGNPQTKFRIRRLQRDLRRKNMMRNVATATAVIVNPTHYAVAIKYEQGSMAAPSVVAKGKNYLAARIRKRAIENQIPIIENPPLAQTLYKSVDVGQEIPAHLYRAVAEILAYIFKLMANSRGTGRR